MLLSEAIELFCDGRASDGFAANTVRNDRSQLTKILKIIGDIDVTKMRPQHLDRVLAVESDRGLAPGTLNMIQSSLSAFSRWCRDREHMLPTQNPVGTRRYRPDPPKRRDFVPVEDFPRLLDAAETGEMGKRDRAFIAAGLFLMCRQSELINLRIKDLNLEHDEIDVQVIKTHDRDLMPVSSELHAELTSYLEWYRAEMGEPLDGDWYLFPALVVHGFHKWRLNPTARISRSQDLILRALVKIGWKDKWVGVHVLRRSAARARLEVNIESGYDAAMREIQSWLHHASIQTTERYLQIQPDRDRRNRRTAGQPMFPSMPVADNVVELHSGRRAHG